MLILAWAICVYLGVMVTAKSLAKQEKNPELLDK